MSSRQPLEPNIPHAPRGGIYGQVDVAEAYRELYNAVHNFMQEVDSSNGNLSLDGAGKKAVARAKSLVYKAKALEELIKAGI